MNTTPKSSHKNPERPSANLATADPELLAAALDGLRRDWSIIAIRRGGKKPLPGIAWMRWQTERPGEDQLRKWLASPKAGGIAVILGEVSGGLVCRDFDKAEAYERWAAAHPTLARSLPTVKTGIGYHVYAKAAGPTPTRKIGDGEIRGEGAYTLLPPSLHPSGCRYRWIIPLPPGDLPLIDLADSGFLHRWVTTQEPRDKEAQVMEGGGGPLCVPCVPCVSASEGELGAAIEAAIGGSLPRHAGERNDKLFDLARRLKGIPELADAPWNRLRPIVVEWHRRALPAIRTEDFLETWADFGRGWKAVRFPAGTEPMTLIAQKARESPPPACAAALPEGVRLLASVCRELQRAAKPDKPFFFLDCRTAGRSIGVAHQQAWKWLGLLEFEGILEVVQVGDPGRRRATEFRYLGDL